MIKVAYVQVTSSPAYFLLDVDGINGFNAAITTMVGLTGSSVTANSRIPFTTEAITGNPPGQKMLVAAEWTTVETGYNLLEWEKVSGSWRSKSPATYSNQPIWIKKLSTDGLIELHVCTISYSAEAGSHSASDLWDSGYYVQKFIDQGFDIIFCCTSSLLPSTHYYSPAGKHVKTYALYNDIFLLVKSHYSNTAIYYNSYNQDSAYVPVIEGAIVSTCGQNIYSYGTGLEFVADTAVTQSQSSGQITARLVALMLKYPGLAKWKYHEIMRRCSARYSTYYEWDAQTVFPINFNNIGWGLTTLASLFTFDTTALTSYSGRVSYTKMLTAQYAIDQSKLYMAIGYVPDDFIVHLGVSRIAIVPGTVASNTDLQLYGEISTDNDNRLPNPAGSANLFSAFYAVDITMLPDGTYYFCTVLQHKTTLEYGRIEKFNILHTFASNSTSSPLVTPLTINGGYVMSYPLSSVITDICTALNDPSLDTFSTPSTYLGKAREAFVDAVYDILHSGQYTEDELLGLKLVSSEVTITAIVDLGASPFATTPFFYKLINVLPGANADGQIKLKEINPAYLKTSLNLTTMAGFTVYYIVGNKIYFPNAADLGKEIRIEYISAKITTNNTDTPINTDIATLLSMSFISRAKDMAVKKLFVERQS